MAPPKKKKKKKAKKEEPAIDDGLDLEDVELNLPEKDMCIEDVKSAIEGEALSDDERVLAGELGGLMDEIDEFYEDPEAGGAPDVDTDSLDDDLDHLMDGGPDSLQSTEPTDNPEEEGAADYVGEESDEEDEAPEPEYDYDEPHFDEEEYYVPEEASEEDIEAQDRAEKMAEVRIPKFLLLIGMIFSAAGFLGMLGLRLGLVQAVLGDGDPYPGIGPAEPMGHVVFVALLVVGFIFTVIWGLKNQSLYMEKKMAIKKVEEEIREGSEEYYEEDGTSYPEKEHPDEDYGDSGPEEFYEEPEVEYESEEYAEGSEEETYAGPAECPLCGTEVAAEAEVCPMCGQEFTEDSDQEE